MNELIFKENMVHGAVVNKNNLNFSAPPLKGKSRALSRSPMRGRHRSPLAVRTNLMDFKKEAREKSPGLLCSKPEAETNLSDDEGIEDYEFSLKYPELDEEDNFYDIVPFELRPTEEEIRDFVFGFHGKLNAFEQPEFELILEDVEPEFNPIELDEPVPLPEPTLDWPYDDSFDDDETDEGLSDCSFNLSFD